MSIRRAFTLTLAAGLLLTGYGFGAATEKERTVITVQVSSAEHEMIEGYFSLGEDLTVMVKPGTELHRFLSRQRGRSVTISVTEGTGRHLSRLDRD